MADYRDQHIADDDVFAYKLTGRLIYKQTVTGGHSDWQSRN